MSIAESRNVVIYQSMSQHDGNLQDYFKCDLSFVTYHWVHSGCWERFS